MQLLWTGAREALCNKLHSVTDVSARKLVAHLGSPTPRHDHVGIGPTYLKYVNAANHQLVLTTEWNHFSPSIAYSPIGRNRSSPKAIARERSLL